MPDIFVPLDTSRNSSFYSDLLRKNVFNDFSLTYVDNNRNQLRQQYVNVNPFRDGFMMTDELMKQFLAAAYKAGVKEDTAGWKTSGDVIKMQLKAIIARNLWDLEAYFVIINELNQPLQAAIAAMKDQTFEKMKLGTDK